MSNNAKKDLISKEIEQTEKEMKLELYKTALKKAHFINEIKSGLGTEIKENPSKVKVIKKTKLQKLKLWLQKIFTKF